MSRVTSRIRLCIVIAVALWGFAGEALGHGLIQSPPSRNWFCGAITKPDEVSNGVAQFPVCGGAFSLDQVAGYNFMSVLTHTLGRSVVGPRPNVCGFNAETFNGGKTVWDMPIDWPTSNITSGPQTFTWNITWGPHFSDTQEFRYWITKPGFQFQVGKPLSFDDFEDQPFCVLTYDDANPGANPNVIPDKAGALFQTKCTVPERSGRQVIYAEWGRNQFTFERFHSCVDVKFQSGPVIDARIQRTPDGAEFVGGGIITLDGRGSVGTGLTYRWDVSSVAPGLYTITNPTSPVATLNLANPAASETVSVTLVVTSSTGTDSATFSLVHRPSSASPWFDMGPLTATARTLAAGNRVSVRTVQNGGQDVFFPSAPLTLTAANASASAWPLALAQAVNAQNGSIRIGVLGAGNAVTPVADATANRIFAMTSAAVTGAFLQVALGAPSCQVNYQIVSQWGNGFQSNLTITNTSATIPVVGYTLTWSLASGESFNNGWNATYAPTGAAMAASNTAGNWNGIISQNGGKVSFGFIGNKGAAAAALPSDFRLNGEPCTTGTQFTALPMTRSGTVLASAPGAPPAPVHHCPDVEPGAAILPQAQQLPRARVR